MDKETLNKVLKLVSSDNDSDAIMGLRGLQALLKAEGVSLDRAVTFALEHADKLRTVDTAPAAEAARAAVSVSGMPQCRVTVPGTLEIIPPGQTTGDAVPLPGEAAADAALIAESLKDALAAAVINKSRFRLKLLDVKAPNGDIVETILQAEYDREGMIPVRVWANTRGEAGTLATVLRRGIASCLPDLAA